MANEEPFLVLLSLVFSCCVCSLFGCCWYTRRRTEVHQPQILFLATAPTAPPSPDSLSVYEVIPEDEPTPI